MHIHNSDSNPNMITLIVTYRHVHPHVRCSIFESSPPKTGQGPAKTGHGPGRENEVGTVPVQCKCMVF